MPKSDETATQDNLTGRAALRNTLAQRAPDAFLTGDEAAIYIDCSRRALLGLVAARKLRVDGRGTKRRVLFRRATLDAFLEQRAEHAL